MEDKKPKSPAFITAVTAVARALFSQNAKENEDKKEPRMWFDQITPRKAGARKLRTSRSKRMPHRLRKRRS